ncbi:MAG: fatty acid desaturase [Bacteroidetes bacterium]|nr:MAG: fatty acid desaturase [Bacteroidota bacterium]
MSIYSDQEIKAALADWPQRFKTYAQANHRKAIWQLVTTFVPFVALWVLMYYSLSWSYWITLGLGLVNAFFTVRIFIIQHDCGHRSYFKDQRWNRFVGWVCSLFTFIPYNYWSQVHDFHHGHSGQLEVRDIGDIQTMTVQEYREATPRQRLGYRIFRMPIITFVIGPVVYLLRNNRFTLVKLQGWQRNQKWLRLNNFLLLAAYVLGGVLLGWKNFLLIQAPIVFFFAIIAVWFFYVQHQHEMAYKQWRDNWDYLLSAIRGSSYYQLPKWLHFLTGNIGYHHIHHLNSKIPSYNLVRCAQENPDLQKYVTSVTFWESLQFMFHKLWDEQTERMITFREFYLRERGLA